MERARNDTTGRRFGHFIGRRGRCGAGAPGQRVQRTGAGRQGPPRSGTIETTVNGRASVGLVLGAGGSRGFAHLGVIKVLEEAGTPPGHRRRGQRGVGDCRALLRGPRRRGARADGARAWTRTTCWTSAPSAAACSPARACRTSSTARFGGRPIESLRDSARGRRHRARQPGSRWRSPGVTPGSRSAPRGSVPVIFASLRGSGRRPTSTRPWPTRCPTRDRAPPGAPRWCWRSI